MTSYQRLKRKNMELQWQVNLFKNALTRVMRVDKQDDNTLLFHFAYARNKIMDESAREQLQYWVAENLDEDTIMHLLKLKKELKKNEKNN